jgi:hypothetical protein
MRSNTAKKRDLLQTEEIIRPKQFLKLVEKQADIFNEKDAEEVEVDYEEFTSKYGIKSDFA